MLKVAVTGGIGSGKSTVSRQFAALGAVVVDSDALARQVVQPGTPGLAAIVDIFGRRVLASDGSLDRAALASIVFADPDARVALEQITHPLVRSQFDAAVATCPADSVVVNDIPLLRTLEVAARYAVVVGVGAPVGVRVRRLIQRGLTEDDARARIAAQMLDEQRKELADCWLDNSGTEAELKTAAAAVWRQIDEMHSNMRAGRPAPFSPGASARWVGGREAAVRRVIARIAFAIGDGVAHLSVLPAACGEDGPISVEIKVGVVSRVQEWIGPLRDSGWVKDSRLAPVTFTNADAARPVSLRFVP
ncbi:dephospho-CoA kinase [Nakamurella antarctica]|uniref:Dephospho-CoA kinase n=1 Tax=Nakamurella antarctica TaxID=1902245 RepID=A0A3G8ZL21_9ACTN|nr:dephospho-CoA kinase [Nakamurella antarctica]AZI57900.1 dephospho-CoA kinase [Nakamurella antarctica]